MQVIIIPANKHLGLYHRGAFEVLSIVTLIPESPNNISLKGCKRHISSLCKANISVQPGCKTLRFHTVPLSVNLLQNLKETVQVTRDNQYIIISKV